MTMRVSCIVAACSLALLAGCHLNAAKPQSKPDDAIQQIREQVEGQRQCAPLLSGTSPIEFSLEVLAGPHVDALVAAGVVRRVLLDRADAEGDRPRVRIEPTSAGMHDIWFRRLDPASRPEPMLCYGRKHVVAVRTGGHDGGSETGPSKPAEVRRYDYRIVQTPSWTSRADIRAAFPFLVKELNRTRTAEQAATRVGDRWTLASDTGPDAGAELDLSEGFFP
ncbi:hypothetical protein [Sphingomonas sp. Leaf242]|uniref:hypothetical protein n=1 Tax=Sphingomonas sp. Leaf242 TaxID=1736304 RepID=UPI0012E0D92F|nr:hypothetical protein [Sphingomonas sp. Leaf242]